MVNQPLPGTVWIQFGVPAGAAGPKRMTVSPLSSVVMSLWELMEGQGVAVRSRDRVCGS